MARVVLSLNAGSSSIKFALFQSVGGHLERLAAGKLEGIGTAPRLRAQEPDGTILAERAWDGGAHLTHEALLDELLGSIRAHLDEQELTAVGHRVVHGGSSFACPEPVTAELLTALEALSPLAPLHQPHNLAAIRALTRRAPNLPQVACFDTAFHQSRPEVATRFALPRRLHDKGIRRYGFHGLSYEYVAGRLQEIDQPLAQGRVIAAHLGNGASLCAMRAGQSVDTTMGFTALDGLMMGTRCGALDPGVILHLLLQEGMAAAEVERLLYEESGLLGVSGISSDMRVLHQSDTMSAAEAIELFTWRVAREAGALVSSMGGLDGLVFTAGIGENDPAVRARICERLAWIGLTLDAGANARNAPLISAPGSRVVARIVPTDEERMIAVHTFSVLDAAPPPARPGC